MPADLDARTPVLVGVGVATQRVDEAADALEPLDLMLEAVRRAGADAGGAHTLATVQRIAVPKGRWRYRNPARAIAQAIGAPGATTVLSTLGVLQQSLINDACARIATGTLSATPSSWMTSTTAVLHRAPVGSCAVISFHKCSGML